MWRHQISPLLPFILSVIDVTIVSAFTTSIPRCMTKKKAQWQPISPFVPSSPQQTTSFSSSMILHVNTIKNNNEQTPSSKENKSNAKLDDIDKDEIEAEMLRQQANLLKLEAELQQEQLTLEKEAKNPSASFINGGSNKISAPSSSHTKTSLDMKTLIQSIVREIDPKLLPPSSLPKQSFAEDNKGSFKSTKVSLQECQLAVDFYKDLPLQLKRSLANAVDLDVYASSPSDIVLKLFENRYNLKASSLKGPYDKERSFQPSPSNETSKEMKKKEESSSFWSFLSSSTDDKKKDNINDSSKSHNDNNIPPILNEIVHVQDKDSDIEAIVQSLLPPAVTHRLPGRGAPTIESVNLLIHQILGRDVFLTSEKPQLIPGGYVIRGQISPDIRRKAVQKNTVVDVDVDVDVGSVLIERIDEKLNNILPGWTDRFQVCYIEDPTPRIFDQTRSSVHGDSNNNAVLLVTAKDLFPRKTGRIVMGSLSVYLMMQFILATYASNHVALEQFHAHHTGDASWLFQELLYPVLLPLIVSQACHELGHLAMAQRGGFKTVPPKVIPFLALPYMTFQTKLRTSPKDMKSLFDFAFVGPALGMLLSSCFVIGGLHLTLHMDTAALEYAPALPVSFLKLSALGGSLIDTVLFGSDGSTTVHSFGSIFQQDPSTPIPLHPYVIGGMTAFLINCLDVLPIGSTDGGRMSQCLFGRRDHVGSVTTLMYVGLLLYALFSGHRTFLLSFIFLSGLLQKDVELPCRNEVDDKVDLPRVGAAFAMWFIAILALTPLG